MDCISLRGFVCKFFISQLVLSMHEYLNMLFLLVLNIGLFVTVNPFFLCLYLSICVYGRNQSGCEKAKNMGFLPFILWVLPYADVSISVFM